MFIHVHTCSYMLIHVFASLSLYLCLSFSLNHSSFLCLSFSLPHSLFLHIFCLSLSVSFSPSLQSLTNYNIHLQVSGQAWYGNVPAIRGTFYAGIPTRPNTQCSEHAMFAAFGKRDVRIALLTL